MTQFTLRGRVIARQVLYDSMLVRVTHSVLLYSQDIFKVSQLTTTLEYCGTYSSSFGGVLLYNVCMYVCM